jgi:hypothetical protein
MLPCAGGLRQQGKSADGADGWTFDPASAARGAALV